MSKTVVILQSNYIPWKGYFDLIGFADEFVFYDHVQFTKNDWRNRNKIQTPNGLMWLSIPVLNKGLFGQSVESTVAANDIWRKKHWKSLLNNYSKAPHFGCISGSIKSLYLEDEETNLSRINYKFISTICRLLNIQTRLTFSRDYDLPGGQTENLVAICSQLRATEYLTGPSAKNYLNEDLFIKNNITIKYADYSNYREYKQLYNPFEHGVSILDLLCCQGPNATAYMKFENEKL